MATVVDRGAGDVPAPEVSEPSRAFGVGGVGLVQWVLAALLLGAGAVHFALAPSHFGESTAEGVGFLVAAWLQVALAVAVVLRPSRRVAIAVVVVSAACVVAWVVSRTAGLPFGEHAGHAESVTIVDGLTVAMEVASIAARGALLSRTAQRIRAGAMAFIGVAAVLLLTSAVLATPQARDHASDAHGDHADATDPDEAAAPITGHVHGSAASTADTGGATDLNGHAISGVKANDVAAETQPDVPLDAATRAQLSEQLLVARAAAMKYPTTADAEAAGYHLVAGFGPGSRRALHRGPDDRARVVDATRAQSLIYSGTSPSSQIVGLMYFGMGETAPEGFAGPNDHWHRHSSVCTTFGPNGIDVPFPPDADVTEEQCASVGGRYMETTGWMVHAWVVPSWESPDGVFSHENPNLRCADGTFDTDAVGKCQGT